MLLEHIAFDTVALTGNNFFRCTRGLILYVRDDVCVKDCFIRELLMFLDC